LRSRQPHTDDDLVLLAEHAGAGVAMVRDIEFLAGSLDGIAHHHERFDGLGYPAGLRGEAIPLAARIVAVADAFDALTTQRPYRLAMPVADAIRVLHDRAGSQFDPGVCDALDKALARHQWEVTARTEGQLAAAGAAIDHDEPEVSDRLAERPDLRAQIHGAPARVNDDHRVST
jgi:HD-GYP domain-containing protein (c-di-GMP phosphodiesterase class II)